VYRWGAAAQPDDQSFMKEKPSFIKQNLLPAQTALPGEKTYWSIGLLMQVDLWDF